MVSKVRIDITTALKIGLWLAPGVWERYADCDIQWDRISREEPDADVVRSPLHGVNTSAVGIEAGAVGEGSGGCDATADIVVNACIAVRGLQLA